MKNKGFIIAFSIYIILFLIDFITTLLNYNIMQYLEANPIFKIGGFVGILLLNAAILAVIYFFYNRTNASIDIRFYLIYILVAVSITRILVIINNILVFSNPPTIEEAQQVTLQAKNAAITWLVMLNLLPYANGIFTYLLFKMDHLIFKCKEQI